MAKVRIVVVEDEIIIADNICDILDGLGYKVFEPAISYSEAINAIEKHHPDILILDIQLSGQKDGIDIAWKAKEEYDIPFIFLTSNADKLTVDRAKKVSPSAYLVKPFTKEELYSSIEIALYNFANSSKETDTDLVMKGSLFIKQKYAFKKLKFEDILFIQSDHVYVEVITKDQQKYVVRGSLNDYITRLDDRFIRAHRKFIVNLIHLDKLESHQLRIGAYDIPIGKNYKSELFKRINLI